MLFAYALEEWRAPGRRVASSSAAFVTCALATALLTLASVVAVTLYSDVLPVIDVNGNFHGIITTGIAPLVQVLSIVAPVMLWRRDPGSRRRSAPGSRWP